MNNRIDFLSIPIDVLTMEETVARIDDAIRTKRQIHHTVVNAGKIVLMEKDKQLYRSVTEADIINADGQAVVWAARFLGKKLPERVAGIDLMNRLLTLANERNYRVFLFGARQEVLNKVVEKITAAYSERIIAGYRNGYFRKEEEKEIAEKIASSGAQLLFVAISSPMKEIFIHEFKDTLSNVNFIMGVGGSFDVLAGFTRRAPHWVQRIGMEWFYRFLQEPVRMWRRYTVGNIQFMRMVFAEKMKGVRK